MKRLLWIAFAVIFVIFFTVLIYRHVDKKNNLIYIDIIPERGESKFFSRWILYAPGKNSPPGLQGYSGIDVNDSESRNRLLQEGFEERNQFAGRTILVLKRPDGSFHYPTYFSGYRHSYGYYPGKAALERKNRFVWRIRKPEAGEQLFLVLVPDQDDRVFTYRIDWEHQTTTDQNGNREINLSMPPPEQLPQADAALLKFIP